MTEFSSEQKKSAIRKHEERRVLKLAELKRRDVHFRRQAENLIRAFKRFPYHGSGGGSLLSKLNQIGLGLDGIERIANLLSEAKVKEKVRQKAKRKYDNARAARSRRESRKPNTRYVEIGFKRLTAQKDYEATDSNNMDWITSAVWLEVRKASQKDNWGLIGQLLDVAGLMKPAKSGDNADLHYRRLADRVRKRITKILKT